MRSAHASARATGTCASGPGAGAAAVGQRSGRPADTRVGAGAVRSGSAAAWLPGRAHSAGRAGGRAVRGLRVEYSAGDGASADDRPRGAAARDYPNAGSIYQPDTARLALFADNRARWVGDTITIVLQENTSASKRSSGAANRTGTTNDRDPHLQQQPAPGGAPRHHDRGLLGRAPSRATAMRPATTPSPDRWRSP